MTGSCRLPCAILALGGRVVLLVAALSVLLAASYNAPDLIGPTSGPQAQRDGRVLVLAYDLHNGGIAQTTRGFLGASRYLGWQVTVIDSKGNAAAMRQSLVEAARLPVHTGVAFIGGDSHLFSAGLLALRRQGRPVIGWHSSPAPGPSRELSTNLTTDPAAVARIAVDYALQSSPGPIGAVILTDSNFEIAMRKTRAMQQALENCKRCTVLAIRDMPIRAIDRQLPPLLVELDRTFGRRWTHLFAINDLYFDNLYFPIYRLGRSDIVSIAAGDGSAAAIRRIAQGRSQQKASVAEPSDQQGWQLADEMNRAFARQPPSGYVSRPRLITRDTVAGLASRQEAARAAAYRARYLSIWFHKP